MRSVADGSARPVFSPFGTDGGRRTVPRSRQEEEHVRKFNLVVIGLASVAGLIGGAIFMFRRSPRTGASFVNSVVNPVLIRRGLAGSGAGEIATLEHIGRRSGQRRLTAVHPEPTPDGFRILVPLGAHSEWARNVVAAGRCRLQLHDVVFDLDEPAMLQPTALDGLPTVVRRFEEYLGFQYIALRRFSSAPGCLEAIDVVSPTMPLPDGSLTTSSEDKRELVSAAP